MTMVVRSDNNTGAHELLAQLERAGMVTATSLILPADITFDRYEAIMRLLGSVHEGVRWLLGDAINQGDAIFGETYTQAVAASGLAEQTLINCASVCRHVPRPLRRSGLSFSHHAEVAYLDPIHQKRLLSAAAENGWTRRELREAAAPYRASQPRIELSSSPGLPETNGKADAYADTDTAEFDAEVKTEPEIVCQCTTCGRFHYADRDVIKP